MALCDPEFRLISLENALLFANYLVLLLQDVNTRRCEERSQFKNLVWSYQDVYPYLFKDAIK